MNKKQVLEIIKAKADKIEYPDLTDKILSKIDFSKTETEVVSPKEANNEVVVELSKPRKRTRKVFIPIMSTLISALLIIVLLFVPHTVKPKDDGPTGKETLFEVTKLKQMIGYEVYSGASLIDFNQEAPLANVRRARKAESEENEDAPENSEPNNQEVTLTNEQIVNKIHDAVLASDMLINKDKFKIKLAKTDNPKYEVLMKCSYVDADNHKITYDFYYNETPDHPEDKNYDDIDEVNSTIDGIMLIEDKVYKVSGSKEVENNESEIELTFYLDENNYFVIKQEMEVDENEYQYRLYKDGQLFQEIKHSIEMENGKKESSYEINDIKNNKKDVISLEFNGTVISAKLVSSELLEEIEVSIDIVKKGYEYHFPDGVITVKKNQNK